MKPKILIVEDNANISKILQKFMQILGAEPLTAGDGVAAMDLARELQPDLIILDVMIPHRSGFEVCQALKADPQTEHIPIFMLTGSTANHAMSDEEWRVKIGADAFFTKPVNREALMNAIRDRLKLDKTAI